MNNNNNNDFIKLIDRVKTFEDKSISEERLYQNKIEILNKIKNIDIDSNNSNNSIEKKNNAQVFLSKALPMVAAFVLILTMSIITYNTTFKNNNQNSSYDVVNEDISNTAEISIDDKEIESVYTYLSTNTSPTKEYENDIALNWYDNSEQSTNIGNIDLDSLTIESKYNINDILETLDGNLAEQGGNNKKYYVNTIMSDYDSNFTLISYNESTN
jgi:hypothetical protein